MSTGCQKDRNTGRQTYRQTDRQTERQIEDRKTFQLNYQNKSYIYIQGPVVEPTSSIRKRGRNMF